MGTDRAFVCPLGRVAYKPAWALQEAIKERLVQAKRTGGAPAHILLLLEHPPVYTLGKSGDASHLLLEPNALSVHGAEFHRIDRGGDITFHGPGQLVGYFLLDLDRIFRDLHRYMRALEEIIIRTLDDFGVPATRIAGRTGVWVGAPGHERKICALGIRSSRWVTMHGIAFNVNTDLSYFRHIVPCGLSDCDVTSLAQELGRHCDEGAVRRRVAHHFGTVFDLETTFLNMEDTWRMLEEFSGMKDLRATLQSQPESTQYRPPDD